MSPWPSANDARADRELAKRKKKGLASPAGKHLPRRVIAHTFWGKAWCDHLERYCDFENRLPRGRTYVRNGSVIHLAVEAGRLSALVQGSELYKVGVGIAPLHAARWKKVVGACAGRVDSLVELLKGKVSSGVMAVVTHGEHGLFPTTREIEMDCSCPDWAGMCKHLAAVLYAVGARLDDRPELLFVLRKVDPMDLLSAAPVMPLPMVSRASTLAAANLGDIFGIELEAATDAAPAPGPKLRARTTTRAPTKKTRRRPRE